MSSQRRISHVCAPVCVCVCVSVCGCGCGSELREDGYLHLRGVLDRAAVLRARNIVTSCLAEDFRLVDTGRGHHSAAWIRPGKSGTLLTGYRPVSHHAAVLEILHSRELAELFRTTIFQDRRPATLDGKWVRIFGTSESTDEHTDYFRFQGVAASMYTCWWVHRSILSLPPLD